MIKTVNTGIYSVSHFLMDFMCHYYVFSLVRTGFPGRAVILFLLYNFIAFALQCPIGALCDRFKGRYSVTFSFLLLLTGFCIGFWWFPGAFSGCIAGMVVCAFANAVLHAGGCKAVMEPGKNGLAAGGVFISFGALGVGLGDYLGSNGISIFPWAVVIVIAIAALINLPVFDHFSSEESSASLGAAYDAKENVLLILCLAAVFVRSYGGFLLPAGFKGILGPASGDTSYVFWAGMLPSVLGFIGKFAGGFAVILLSKLVKQRKDLRAVNYIYGFIALLVSAVLLLIVGQNPVLCAASIVLFNSVMPVTLYEIYCIFPKNPGFSLGLTTLLLFAGYLPTVVFRPEGLQRTVILAVLMTVGVLCLGFAAARYVKDAGKE